MADGTPILIGLVMGIYFFFKGFKTLKLKRTIENLPTSKIRSVAVGPVEVEGHPKVDGKLFESPLSGKKCIYYKWLIEVLVRTRRSSHWRKYKSGDSENKFYIKDETGEMLVDPKNAELYFESDLTISNQGLKSALPTKVEEFNKKMHITNTSGFFKATYRWSEYVLESKDDLYILGTAKIRNDIKNAKTNQEGLVICKDGRNLFYMSDKKESDVIKKIGSNMLWEIWGGAALFVLCSGIIIFQATSEYSEISGTTKGIVFLFLAAILLIAGLVYRIYSAKKVGSSKSWDIWSGIAVIALIIILPIFVVINRSISIDNATKITIFISLIILATIFKIYFIFRR